MNRTTLSYAILASLSLAHATLTHADDETLADFGTLEVTVSADASGGGLMPAYAGGQVATGSRVGVFGNQKNSETPFSTIAYTSDYIKNTGADSVGDVLKKDPTVRVTRGFGNFQESYVMRGFVANSDDVMYNGLYGILPRQYIASELFERVEVQRGAGAFLNGMSPSGAGKGGTIALLPKRAGNHDTKSITLGYGMGSRGEIALDLGHRFGDEHAYGVRLNAVQKDGDTSIDDESSKTSLVSLGLDYRGSNARLSADLGYQNNQLSQTRTSVTLINNIAAVPTPPKNDSNWAMPWTYSNEKDTFGTLRAEYDVNNSMTAYAAYGFRVGKEQNSLANLRNVTTNGNGTVYRFDNARKDTIHTGELGLKGKFNTKGITHDWVGAFNYYNLDKQNAYIMDPPNTRSTNLYRPTYHALPAWSPFAISGTNSQDLTMTSLVLGDNLSALDDKLHLMLGVRYARIDDKGYNGNGVLTTHYKKNKTTPALGLSYAINDTLSVYGNYIESLQKGETAPNTASNRGEIMSPYVSKQKEIGLKYDTGTLGLTLAAFHTDKPRYVISNGYFGEHGKNIHKGIELGWFGTLSDGVRILGGYSYLDTHQKDTGVNSSEGKQVIGVAKHQANLGLEYDVPSVQGLTLTGDAIYTGKRPIDDANNLFIDGTTIINLGARYETHAFGKPTTLRATLENITNKDYWASAGGYETAGGNNGTGYLVLGNPFAVKVSATVAF